MRRLREEVDIGLLLTVAGSTQSLESWLVGTAALSLGVGAGIAGLDGFGLATSGELPLPLWTVLIAMLVIAAVRYVSLRGRAATRQARVGEQLADALLGLAILVPGIPPEDALGLLSRCQRNAELAAVLDEQYLERLLGKDAYLRSTRERYSSIGQALRIPMFQELSSVMRGIESEGLSPREEYPALSRISAETRLAQNRLRAARAKTGAAAAIALLLIPLLIMVGGGIAFAFLGSVNG
jgi:Flp pilus assembly protein TadB